MSAVIIGASHAAAQLCISLRQGGWSEKITVIGDEDSYPYHRPPLSKDYLSGQKEMMDILIRPQEAYRSADVHFKLGVSVSGINRNTKTVTTHTGQVIPYKKLILATGARVRKPSVPGQDLPNVYYLRSSADVLAIKEQIPTSKQVVIIGGGYIGLEAAASLRKLGLEVAILESMPRILQRVTSPNISTFYRRIHTEEGVKILEGVKTSEIYPHNNKLRVMVSEGQSFEADFVIIGIGVVPNTDLAEQANLNVQDGIEVNEFCQTSDPDIYAVGDVTWHYSPVYSRYLRLESVPNATEQAKVAASHMNGKPVHYNSLPWFWSDQFNLKLQIAGLSHGYDNVVVRGDIATSRSFAAFYFKGERLLAVDAVNSPREFMFGRQILTSGVLLEKGRLANTDFNLQETVQG